jgi:hypothetical protein
MTEPKWLKSFSLDYVVDEHTSLTMEFEENDSREVVVMWREQAAELHDELTKFLTQPEAGIERSLKTRWSA